MKPEMIMGPGGGGGDNGVIDSASVRAKAKPAKKTPPLYNFRRVKGAGVLFVLLWNLLIFSYQTSALGNLVDLVRGGIGGGTSSGDDGDPWNRSFVAALLQDCLPKLLYPFAGWLADAKLGRYKVMRYSLWMMWVGSVLLILTSILRYTLEMLVMPDKHDLVLKCTLPVYVVIYLVNVMGTAGYHVNVIPFGIDQMEGASGEEISSFIHWYYWTRNFNFGMIVQFALQTFYCKVTEAEFHQRRDLFVSLIQMVFLTAAVCLDFIFSSKLHKDAKIHDTVKKVKDISTFILRHDQPVGHRKAHTFTYEAPPVRSDFAKQSYGGPYEDDAVEEVTSFWRIIVILLAWGFGGVFLIQTGYYMYPSFYEHMSVTLRLKKCTSEYLVTNFVSILTFTLCIPIFEFLIYPFVRNRIPRTTVRIGVGMFVVLFGFSALLTVDVVAHTFEANSSAICMFYSQEPNIPGNSLYLVVVIVIMAIGELLVFLPMLEFICAQAPYSMRGLMIGINFMIFGLSVGLLSVVLLAFSLGMRSTYNVGARHIWGPSCGTWYISTVLIVGCVGVVLYIVAAKRYKKRQRGGQKDVNQQTILEGYYERSVKYKRPMNLYYQN